MLPRKYRLTAEKDFNRIFKRGRSVHGQGLGLKIALNQLEVSRFAFVVSTKVSKKAVVRNRLKRQMREIVHEVLKDMKQGTDVVVMARKEIVDIEFDVLRESLLKALKKAKLLG